MTSWRAAAAARAARARRRMETGCRMSTMMLCWQQARRSSGGARPQPPAPRTARTRRRRRRSWRATSASGWADGRLRSGSRWKTSTSSSVRLAGWHLPLPLSVCVPDGPPAGVAALLSPQHAPRQPAPCSRSRACPAAGHPAADDMEAFVQQAEREAAGLEDGEDEEGDSDDEGALPPCCCCSRALAVTCACFGAPADQPTQAVLSLSFASPRSRG